MSSLQDVTDRELIDELDRRLSLAPDARVEARTKGKKMIDAIVTIGNGNTRVRVTYIPGCFGNLCSLEFSETILEKSTSSSVLLNHQQARSIGQWLLEYVREVETQTGETNDENHDGTDR